VFNNIVKDLIGQADIMTRCVLFGLFIASVFCFAIVLYKYLFFKKELKSLRMLEKKVREVKKFDDYLILRKEFSGTLGGDFLDRSLAELKKFLQKNIKIQPHSEGELESAKGLLSDDDVVHLDEILNQTVDHVLIDAEQYLPVLGTSAAVSPLVGLFGTVWGLIHAFINISREKSADIVAIAPGIAEALTTTLGGLIVAIPAMIFFHYFSNKIRKLEQILIAISDHFFNNIRRTFLKR
jgi:biopolymer transport protein TolQ